MNMDQLKNNKYISKCVESLKNGFQDIQTVVQEGNFKLFLKQFITLLVVFLLYRYFSGNFAVKVRSLEGKIDSLRVQQRNEQTYQTNKKLLMSLEPRFPNVEGKNEWLLGQIIDIFKKAELSPDITGMQTEDAANPTYITASLPVNSVMEFEQFANLIASVENREEFVKISGFSLEKDTDPTRVKSNKVTLTFNTVFPKEKIAKKLFKDYDRLMEAIRPKKEEKAPVVEEDDE